MTCTFKGGHVPLRPLGPAATIYSTNISVILGNGCSDSVGTKLTKNNCSLLTFLGKFPSNWHTDFKWSDNSAVA